MSQCSRLVNVTDEQSLELLVSMRALSPYRKTVLLRSTDQSAARTSLTSMLSPLLSVLTERLQFSVQCDCCICAVSSSPLYMTRVEAVAAGHTGYNLMKLRLSAKYYLLFVFWFNWKWWYPNLIPASVTSSHLSVTRLSFLGYGPLLLTLAHSHALKIPVIHE